MFVSFAEMRLVLQLYSRWMWLTGILLLRLKRKGASR